MTDLDLTHSYCDGGCGCEAVDDGIRDEVHEETCNREQRWVIASIR